MTKKQVLFWRFILIFIIILGGAFIVLNIPENKSIHPIVKIKKIIKNIDENKNNNKTIEKEIELIIRPDNFYKDNKK